MNEDDFANMVVLYGAAPAWDRPTFIPREPIQPWPVVPAPAAPASPSLADAAQQTLDNLIAPRLAQAKAEGHAAGRAESIVDVEGWAQGIRNARAALEAAGHPESVLATIDGQIAMIDRLLAYLRTEPKAGS